MSAHGATPTCRSKLRTSGHWGSPDQCGARGTSKVTHSGHGSRAACRFGVNLDAKSKRVLAESQAWIEDNQEKHQNDRSHVHGANL